MKRKLLFAICVLTIYFSQGQYVPIDTAFEDVLIAQGIDSEGISDSRILLSDALSTTSLNLSGSTPLVNNPPGLGLFNINGIEFFTNLETLRIEGNNITNLDLTQNTFIRELRAWNNDMETLIVTGLNNLQTVGLNFNSLTNVDFSTNGAIQELDITDNNLTTISMGNKVNLGKFTLSNNPNLNSLNISGVDGNLLTFDTRGNTNLSCIEVSSITNANSQAGWQKEPSTSYSENCGQNYTQIPDPAFENYLITQGIDSQGIANGRVLTADIQNVLNLDMQNLGITNLSGIEDFTALQTLNVNNNSISTVDLSANVALTSLSIQSNLLSSVNVTQNINLITLNIAENSINTIDLSQNTLLEIFTAYLCNLQTLDLSTNVNLEELTIYRNSLTALDVTSNTNLKYINAEFMNLGSIDVSQNPVLEFLLLSSTGLAAIDTSNNPLLTALLLGFNSLTTLDISNLPNLNSLYVNDNNLTAINVRQNPSLNIFDAQNNSGLSCIEVIDVNTAENQFNWRKDTTTVYSENCNGLNYTLIPDLPFENYLITQGVDSQGIADGRVLTADIQNVLNLDMQSLGITNLSGIEDFTALQTLNVNNNSISTVDLSANVVLTSLSIQNNNLGALDVTQNINLTYLDVARNINLTGIDLSQNTALTLFFGYLSGFQSINISNNTLLEILGMADNSLTSIDLSQNTLLREIFLDNNDLESLDLSAIPVAQLDKLFVCNNPLTCIQVNDVTAANNKTSGDCPARPNEPIGWHKDSSVNYSLDCTVTTPFTVNALIGGDVLITGDACCPEYQIQEGQLLEIYFDADTNATLGEEYIVQVSFTNGTADEQDISIRDSSPNFQYTYSVKSVSPDNTLQIDIRDDFISEPNGENLQITLIPVGSNFIFSGTTVYNVNIIDKPFEVFTVATTIIGAGTGPNYEITEGQSFTLNFNADNSAQDGFEYTPIIEFRINGVIATDDFLFNENNEIPNTAFNVSTNNPDGSITITVIDDDIQEGDEIYNITVSSPDPNIFTMSGSTTHTITVKDKGNLYTGPLSITTSLSNAGTGPYYEVEEGSTFNLNIDTENTLNFGESFQLEIEFSTYKIGSSNDFDRPNFREIQDDGDIELSIGATDNIYPFEIRQNQVDGNLEFTVVDDAINENMEEVVITVKSTSEDQTISIDTFIVKIKANDPLEVEVNLENAGTNGNFSVEEGSTFNLTANILGSTNEVFGFDIIDNTSTAIYNEDYFYSSNQTITDFNIPIDLSVPITVYLDSITENTEQINFKLPAPDGNFTWANADANGELQFEVSIIDKIISIAPEVTDLTIGADDVYEINEGNNIELSLNSLNILSDSQFKNVPLVYEVINSTAEEGVDFEIIGSELIFNQNQIISINTLIDGVQEQDEIFEIRFPKPKGNIQWENAISDGSISFRFRLKDAVFSDTVENYTVELTAEFEFLNADGILEFGQRDLSFENGSYTIKDNETLSINIASPNSNSITKGIRLEAIDNMDALGTNYSAADISRNQFFTFSLNESIRFKAIAPNEANKTFQLNLTPTSENYSLTGPDNSLINYLETFAINVTVEGTGQIPTQEIITEVIGATENINDQDAIVSEYLVQERDTITILLSSSKPNPNQGATYNMGFVIDTATSTLSPEDYLLTITDSEGNDMEGSLNNYTVNNNAEFDAKVTIIFLEDNVAESTEELKFAIVPDVTFGEFGSISNFRTKLSSAQESDQKEYRIKVSEPGASASVYAVLSNTGSTEGTNEPDIITCSLFNLDNTPFTSHSSSIEIPYNFIEYDGGEALRLLEDEFNPDADQFTFAPGQSQASINVLYDAEEDVNDIDCDYYYIGLQESNSSIANNVVISKLNYLVKVADLSEFLIFVDLDITDPRKIRPVVRNRHPDNDYNEGGELDLRKTIDLYEVEENTPLNFTIDAAKPVAAGKTYLLNIMFNESSTAKFQSDYTFNNGDNTTNLPLVVKKDEVDYEVGFLIEPDQVIEPNETFTISFQEPKYEKLYRYSKKDSRSYDQSYQFRILESLPVSIASDNTVKINEELPLESTGEFLISVDRSSEREKNKLEIEFELLGDATFGGDSADYIIESQNKFIMASANSGILYVNENDSEVKLKITPINDDLVEGEETITLKLIDAFGYYLNVNEASSLTITDDDKADFKANFKNEITTLFESRNSPYEDELIFSLDALNTTDEEIRIEFSIDVNDTATFDEDYKLYYINSENSRVPITTIDDFFITIPVSNQEGRLVIEILEDSFFDEEEETITISIKDSEDYITENPSINIITIRNESEDGTSTVSIFAEVISSSCEGGKNGRIKVSNLSSYTFEATISNENGLLADKTTSLPPTTGNNSENATFTDLTPGDYTVFLTYKGTEPLPEDYIPPSFELTVRTPTDPVIVSSAIDTDLGLAKLQVRGSLNYEVKRNGESFRFAIGSTDLATIEVPLVNGLNKLELKGDADCLQAIEQNLYLNSLKPYPNPTQNMLYIGGFYAMGTTVISIADITGKTIINNQQITIKNGVLEIDISELAIGVYVANVKMSSGSIIGLKIVKK